MKDSNTKRFMKEKETKHNQTGDAHTSAFPKYRYGRVVNCNGLIFRVLRDSLVQIQLSVLKTYAEIKAGGAWGGSYPLVERRGGFDSRLCFHLNTR
jgi:hypothetical protein